VTLCIGYLGDMIMELVGTGEKFDLDVSYSLDGPNLLGTGGALRKALPLLGNDFFVLYGDSFLPIDFSAVQKAYESSKCQAIMTVLANDNRWDKSNVLYVDGRILEYNKFTHKSDMTHIDYGLGVVSASVLNHYPINQALDMATIYQILSKQGKLVGFEVFERFYEIGSHSGIKEAENYFLRKDRI